MNKLRVILDKWLLDNWHLIPFLSLDQSFKHDFPTKRLIQHCFTNYPSDHISDKVAKISHMYAYDKTVTKEDLSLIHNIYETCTRERVRQILCKFVRTYYKKRS